MAKKGKKGRSPTWRQKQKEIRKERRAKKRRERRLASAQTKVRRASQTTPWPSPLRSSITWEEYRFLNPYNFVRYLPEPADLPNDVEVSLLGRCPPPPHDRYVGLTGKITCRLTAVTPLFIADSHDAKTIPLNDDEGRTRKHTSCRFFQIDGEDVIPATSLRGMIRSVFEAVTNSCFGVFAPDERLDYRQAGMAQDMRAAVVTKVPSDEYDEGEVVLCKEARLPAYTDGALIEPEEWKCGERGYTIVSEGKFPKVQEMVVRDKSTYENATEGWVKITGRNIPDKKHERFFFCPEGKDKAKRVPFSWERMQDYNAILKEQVEDETRNFRTQYQHRELDVGDLVYVRLNDSKDEMEVLDISLVKVPRLKFRKSLADLLSQHLHPCASHESLCPACRVFGWVKQAPQHSSSTPDKREHIAYAGRVRFSFGKLVEDKGVYADELPLAILSTPKPTTTLFYLFKGNPHEPGGEPPNGDTETGYKDGYKLRGRKFYRHHGSRLNFQEFARVDKRRDHQNRSVRGVRVPGNVFEFTVEFESLAPVELGALLWTLDLDGEGLHRLGYAKPLGFGSVRIEVEEVRIVDWQQRLRSADVSAGWRQASQKETGRWIGSFVKAMERAYGNRFSQLDNILDLLALLKIPSADLPIHYPRTDVFPKVDGKNFEWFMENARKSKKGESAGPHYALALPAEDPGLPLLRGGRLQKQGG